MICRKSTPVVQPSLSQTPTNASSGVLPAPAPKRRTEPSIWVAPARTAITVLATPRPRFSWPWKPTVRLVADLGDERGDPVGASAP